MTKALFFFKKKTGNYFYSFLTVFHNLMPFRSLFNFHFILIREGIFNCLIYVFEFKYSNLCFLCLWLEAGHDPCYLSFAASDRRRVVPLAALQADLPSR